ncbi:RadC family protein [Clostridium fallax]|uniref:DNA replication and repair protein RadC n=1 Tax=Clostridium fallax TaxID=1533 RepID=A0A1M4VB70_9CLOT|nr:DNA repair protein RadC [Clostridium fallax]SHE66212.1 DNA replication and repair protein RadC [Clostridium fallax]SQB05802.1 DNA repair protein RadC [Clostridium fallax]
MKNKFCDFKNLTMKDIPKLERPQERLKIYGAESLSNSELLALILRTGTSKENILSLSGRILKEVEGINGLLRASSSDLMKIKGVKEAKSSQILALCELFKRFKYSKLDIDEIKVTEPENIANYVMGYMMNLKQEVLKVIMLNTKNAIIGDRDVFKGTLNSSIVHPREVFLEAIKFSSASIIICHNHPSGDPSPSEEDINITFRLKECGKVLGIDLLDHIIIGNYKFISLKEKGII